MTDPGLVPYSGPPPTRPPERWTYAQPGWYPSPGWYPPPTWYPPPVQMRWAPPPGTAPHQVPQPFLLAMRARDWAWWRPVLGIGLLAAVYLVLNVLATVIGLLGFAVAGGGHLPDLAVDDLTDPRVLLFVNVTLIVAIPCVWLAWAVAHGMAIGWSSSVLGHLRRRLILPFMLRALAALGTAILLTFVLGLATGSDVVAGPVRSFGWLLLVVVLTTPLQSAAEEYVFRGYLSQAIAGWLRRSDVGAVVAALLTAALFSLAHAPHDVATFLDRFAVGLAASAVVWLTGGLEAAIVLHAVNNVLVFLLAGALGDGGAGADSSGGVGLVPLLLTLAGLAGYVTLVARSRARLQLETVTAATAWSGVVPAAG